MDEQENISAKRQDDPTIVIFLGLYLLLLAFFILLTTISTFEETKTKAVLESLNSTFASEILPTTSPAEFTSRVGAVMEQDFLKEVAVVFETAIPVARVETLKPGQLMRITFPVDDLFQPDAVTFRPERKALLDRIAVALGSRPPGQRFDLEFQIGSRWLTPEALARRQPLEVARVGEFARHLIARGGPPENIVVGLNQGGPPEASLLFRVRRLDEARIDFSGKVE